MYFKSKHIIFLFALIIVGSCAKENEQQATAKTLSKSEVYNFISGELTRTNKAFDWNTASDDLIFAAGRHSDAIFSIGYQPNGFIGIKDKIHQIDLNDNTWVNTREMIEKMILEYEKTDKTPEGFSVLAPVDKKFPHIYAIIKNKELITKLRSMPEVRFVEPLGYSLEPEVSSRSSSGCSGSPNPNINAADYTCLLYTSPTSGQLLFVMLGSLFAVIGNFMNNIKPNYFVGIRLPWTLENEDNWRKTHQLGGKVWVIGGLLIAVMGILLSPVWMSKIMLAIIVIMVFVPAIYSYRHYQQSKMSLK